MKNATSVVSRQSSVVNHKIMLSRITDKYLHEPAIVHS